MKTNKKMDKILNNYFNIPVEVSLEQIVDKSIVEPKFKFINGCILMDNDYRKNLEDLDWTIVLNNHGSKTAFECSTNEVQINSCNSGKTRKKIKDYELVKLGILVFENWRQSIKKLIGDNECEFIMSLNGDYLTMRVCLSREGESWLTDDLEGYKYEAIAIF